MSHSHSPAASQQSSIWSKLNLLIAAALVVFVLYFGLVFVIGGVAAAKKIRTKDAPPTPAPAAAAAPAAASTGPAQEILLKPDAVNPMAYATNTFTVKAGQTVKLTFDNNGAGVPQPHNFVLGKAGPKEPMLALAMKVMTDPKALANGYVPEDPLVIAHTKLLQPGQKETIEFTLPSPGDYPFVCTFPGHSIMMNGVIKAQ